MGFDNDLNKVTKADANGVKSKLIKLLISHSKEISSAVVIGVIITVFSSTILEYIFAGWESDENAMYIQHSPQVEISNPSYREYFIRGILSNVRVNISSIKMRIDEYYQMNGEFPMSNDDINISLYDLDEHDHINSSYLTDKGGIGVHLSKELGENKYLALQPTVSKNGAFIKWRCITNVDEKYLGISQNRICEFQENL